MNKKKSTPINIKQDLFCFLYTSDAECFGNATKSYAYAYDIEPNESCASNGSRLLRNDKVRARINTLLDALINPETVDRELIKLVMQNGDLGVKIAAIREYNKVKGRVAEKIDQNVVYAWATDHDLRKGAKID